MTKNLKLYFIGVSWFILSTISSSINDIISKYTGSHLGSYEITFLRFIFGTITLIPFIIYYGKSTLYTSRPWMHIARGFLLFWGIAGWTHGLSVAPVTTATIVSFTIPIFVLIFGAFFLKEHIIWQRWFVTIFVFIGLFITVDPQTAGFNPSVLALIGAAIFFAILDIINKIFVIKESMISMLFYSALITAIFALPFALYEWVQPTMWELLLLFILGGSANLILFFLLKAFAAVDATALAPYRYFELLISGSLSYLVFAEVPSDMAMIGAIIIVPSTLFIIYSEKQNLEE